MKLKLKVYITLGIIWGFFLACTYINFIGNSWINVALLTISFVIITLYALHKLIFKRIDYFIEKLSKIAGIPLKHPIKANREDELSIILLEMNKILENTPVTSQQLKQFSPLSAKESQKNPDDKPCLATLVHYDPLTNLPNQIFFNEVLNKAISHAKRHHKFLALLYINIDDFKNINATLGRSIGDQMLQEMGKKLASTLRAEDLLAKLDADEFIILLTDVGKPKFASSVAEKLLKTFALPIKIHEHECLLTASIGICIYPNDGSSLEELLKNVDTALHKVKHAGKNNYQFYTKEMDIEAHEYIQLESALRSALQKHELTLYYQPELHLKRGNISGVEALIRWEHPEWGIISPAKIIPLAEECGLIMQIGEWALREACKINKYWQDEGYEHITIGVNLSARQFYHPEVSNIIAKVLKETQLNPSYLEIEITENIVMDNIEIAATILEKIKATGVRIAIDHFGTGYTSISHLKKFPVSVIKIDQTFVKGVPYTPNDLAIVNAFIALAHNLGLEVVAEGIETADQVQYLTTQNCDMVQGYFLSYPLPAQKIVLQFKKLMDEVMFK